jgi:D-tyrosyl-tRNA(Tyr) deacylase
LKVIIQRVSQAEVVVDSSIVGKISKGFLVYVCFVKADTEKQISDSIKKIINLRIFEDENRKMNKNIKQINGEILSISQFTLSWDGSKGNRPSFDQSMEPKEAQVMYDRFNLDLERCGVNIQTGIFGANMKVHSINDGPVTISLEFI